MHKNITQKLIIQKSQKENDSDSYFDNTSEQEDLFQSKNSNDYFNSSSDSENEYKTKKPEITYITETYHFGRFDEILGNGSYKKVYRGYDYNEGREIAWYEIEITDSEENNLNKIKEEMSIMKNLKHPNIIQYYYGWLDQNKKKVYMITEFFTGGTLKNHLKKSQPPRLRVIKKWIKEILKGLNYLHSKEIIHRDIKCENFFFDRINGTVKIGDLGESQFLKGYKFLSNFVGTEGFIAPEVHEGKYNTKADIYSLGMAIIEMLTLETPYKECDGILQIYDKEKKNIFPESLKKICNLNVVNFIKLCLKNQNERPSAKELLFNKWLNDDLSDENDKPVFIKEKLRLNAFKINYSKNANCDKKKYCLNQINSFSPRYLENTKKIQREFCYSPKIQRGISYDNEKKNQNQCLIDRNSSKETIQTESTFDSNRNLYNIKKKYSSFKIDIKDINKEEKKNKNEIEIQFIIGKYGWKNKKMLTCPYNLKIDTVVGLINELTKAINLDKDDITILTNKLNDSIQNYMNSKRKILDEFNQKYNSFINTINNIKNCDYSYKLNKFSEKYININNNNQSDLLSKLEKFKRIKENLSKLFQCN